MRAGGVPGVYPPSVKKRTLKVYAELIEVASMRRLITYSELAERCGYTGPMAPMNVKHALVEIREAEAASGRQPGLDALAVSKHEGTPGHGYNEGDEDAWRQDVAAVYAAWSTLDE